MWGVYYYYIDPQYETDSRTDEDINGLSREELIQHRQEREHLTYPVEFEEVLGEIEPIDPVYELLHRYISITPKELFQSLLNTIDGIRQKFTDYSGYYQAMGYEAFAAQWRQEILAVLEEHPMALSFAHLDNISMSHDIMEDWGIGHFYNTTSNIWELQWTIGLDDYQAVAVFLVKDGQWCCLTGLYFQARDVPEEMEAWSDQIRQISQ